MNLDYFKAAEKDIASLAVLKKSLVYLQRKRDRLINKGCPKMPGAANISNSVYTSSHNANDALGELLAVSEVINEMQSTEDEISVIEAILAELPEEQRKVVTMFYIEHRSAERIAEAIFVESVKTVYNIRNKGVAQFALLYYGALAKSIDKVR